MSMQEERRCYVDRRQSPGYEEEIPYREGEDCEHDGFYNSDLREADEPRRQEDRKQRPYCWSSSGG